MVLTLFRSVAERLMQVVCGLIETCCILLLFGLRIDHDNLHSPVSKRKASDTTVSARSAGDIVSKKKISRLGQRASSVRPLCSERV